MSLIISLLLYAALALLAAIFYFYNSISKKYSYWKNRGVPQLPTELLYGNAKELIQLKKFEGAYYKDAYFRFKKMGVQQGGVYNMTGVTWVPVDPQLIKTILTQDFIHFSAHNSKIPGLAFNNLFHMNGEEWKDMRKKLTPTFTSGKMKMMFDIVLEKTFNMDELVESICKKGEPVEMKNVLIRFTTDIIASCGFGIESNVLKDTNSEFYHHVKDNVDESAEEPQGPSVFKIILKHLGFDKREFPNFKAMEDFFRGVVLQAVKYREENRVVRKDFLQLMLQLRNKGVITELSNENEDVFQKTVKDDAISLEDIAGQCLMFFSAGFGTSSATMSFAMLELAQNQDVQRKLREQVREVLLRHNGKLSYEAVQEMTYCEQVIYETLRKYPALPILLRLCTKNYTIPGTNSVIEKDTGVAIPVWGLHMDPEYFPDPEKFIPERFSPENKNKIKDFTFLPFGEGPRMCLGLRFGLMQSKAGLASLINNYSFTLNKKTPYPPKFMGVGFGPLVRGGFYLDAVKLNK